MRAFTYERAADAGDLIGRLMHKLDPEMTDARGEPFGQMKARFLRFGSRATFDGAALSST